MRKAVPCQLRSSYNLTITSDDMRFAVDRRNIQSAVQSLRFFTLREPNCYRAAASCWLYRPIGNAGKE